VFVPVIPGLSLAWQAVLALLSLFDLLFERKARKIKPAVNQAA
jgi:hypothetical protein